MIDEKALRKAWQHVLPSLRPQLRKIVEAYEAAKSDGQPVELSIEQAVANALHGHSMLHTRHSGLEDGMPLVDMLCPEEDTDIARGREELDHLAESICDSISDVTRLLIPNWLMASAKALLDLDEKKLLAPHGIGGHARSVIQEFVNAYTRQPPKRESIAERRELVNSTSGWKLLKKAFEWLSANHDSMPHHSSIEGWIENQSELIDARIKYGDLALSEIEDREGA